MAVVAARVQGKRTRFVALAAGFAMVATVGCNHENNNWRFLARVVGTNAQTVCLKLVDDGPGYINNDCLDRADVVGLPADIGTGECLRLNQKLHADLVYEGRGEC